MARVATGMPLGIWTIEMQGIEALERFGLHRHAQHRQGRLRRNHPGQVRRAAGARDDDAEPA